MLEIWVIMAQKDPRCNHSGIVFVGQTYESKIHTVQAHIKNARLNSQMTRNTLDACILLSDRKFCVSMGFLRGDCIWDLHNLMIFELNILLVHVHIEYICGWCNFSDTRLNKFPLGRWRILPWCNRKTLYGINLDTLMKILQLFKNNRIFEDLFVELGV